jgi:hypothetical protein
MELGSLKEFKLTIKLGLNDFKQAQEKFYRKTLVIYTMHRRGSKQKRLSCFIFSLYYRLLLAYQSRAEEAEYPSNSRFPLVYWDRTYKKKEKGQVS